MNLEQYLEAIRTCPDGILTSEYGINDNWPIFLSADFGKVLAYFNQSGKYRFKENHSPGKGLVIHRFDYVPGTVRIQAYDWISGAFTTGSGCNNTEQERIESEKQRRDYNTTILLHPYQEKKIDNTNHLRALAIVIGEIGDFLLQEKIPACLPRSIGKNHKNDFSKIVYYRSE